MREVTLEEFLDGENLWTDRLLGEKSFQQVRNAEQVDREYDQDVYGRQLKEYQADPDLRNPDRMYGGIHEIVASIGDRLFRLPFSAFVGIKRATFVALLEKFDVAGELCELGAGAGQNHLWLNVSQPRPVYGGEYSQNAVKLADHRGLEVSLFNFYEMKDYELIRNRSTVFTFHAIEQIPDAACIIAGLKSRREQIDRVIHFEPLYRESRCDLLGRLRNRYTEINDYNRNLLDCLQRDPEIEIEYLEEDAFGNNPLNPASVVVWRFR